MDMARHQAQTRASDAVSGVEQHLGQPPVTPDEQTKSDESCKEVRGRYETQTRCRRYTLRKPNLRVARQEDIEQTTSLAPTNNVRTDGPARAGSLTSERFQYLYPFWLAHLSQPTLPSPVCIFSSLARG